VTLTLWLFGRELLSLRACKDEPATEPEQPRMEAGSGHNFERDMNPPDPVDPYREGYEQRLGFR
jgi:hypothetical protein